MRSTPRGPRHGSGTLLMTGFTHGARCHHKIDADGEAMAIRALASVLAGDAALHAEDRTALAGPGLYVADGLQA